MNIHPLTVTVSAPRDTVFNFLADIENLPRWAGAWCERLALQRGRWWALTRHADQRLGNVAWQAGDWFVFGAEASGLPVEVIGEFAAYERVRLPMQPGQRSLNLSNAVAVVVFDAWRQCGYAGGV